MIECWSAKDWSVNESISINIIISWLKERGNVVYRYRLIIDRPVYCNYFGGKWRILISSRGDRVRFSSAFGRVAVEKNADRRVSKLSLSGKKRVDRRGNEQREWHEATRANSWIVCKTTAAPPRHRFHTRRLICAFRELLPFFPPPLPFFPL